MTNYLQNHGTKDLATIPHKRRREEQTRCWLWQGHVGHNGYGQVRYRGRTTVVHRATYEELIGPIPEGLDLDHLCRVRNCYNPDHLEPVTRKENLRRGREVVPVSWVCPKGHVYDWPPAAGRHRCKQCKAEYDRARPPRNPRA